MLSRISYIFQDSRLAVWVATENSLDLFQDGKVVHFNSFNFAQYAINQIAEDKNGYIWIATDDGLLNYDWKTKKVKRHLQHGTKNTGTVCSTIHSVYKDKKMICG